MSLVLWDPSASWNIVEAGPVVMCTVSVSPKTLTRGDEEMTETCDGEAPPETESPSTPQNSVCLVDIQLTREVGLLRTDKPRRSRVPAYS